MLEERLCVCADTGTMGQWLRATAVTCRQAAGWESRRRRPRCASTRASGARAPRAPPAAHIYNVCCAHIHSASARGSGCGSGSGRDSIRDETRRSVRAASSIMQDAGTGTRWLAGRRPRLSRCEYSITL